MVAPDEKDASNDDDAVHEQHQRAAAALGLAIHDASASAIADAAAILVAGSMRGHCVAVVDRSRLGRTATARWRLGARTRCCRLMDACMHDSQCEIQIQNESLSNGVSAQRTLFDRDRELIAALNKRMLVKAEKDKE